MKRVTGRAGGTQPHRPNKTQRTGAKPKPPTVLKGGSKQKSPPRFKYEICVSFAGENRDLVSQVVSSLKRRRIKCFYDFDEQAVLLGKDLFTYLDQVYRKEARFCIMFISEYYPIKQWTNHERRSIQARMFESKDDYLIPVRLDDTEVPGVLSTLGYIDGRRHSVSEIATLIKEKVRGKALPKKRTSKLPVEGKGRRVNWTHMTSLRKLRKALSDPVALALLNLTASRAGHLVPLCDVLSQAGITETRRGMTGLGLLTKTIKREFNLTTEKVTWPVERHSNSDKNNQTSYSMTPAVAEAWLRSAT